MLDGPLQCCGQIGCIDDLAEVVSAWADPQPDASLACFWLARCGQSAASRADQHRAGRFVLTSMFGRSRPRSREGEVVELLFRNPVVYAPLVKNSLDISNQGALNLLRGLQRRGWVDEYARSGRGGTKLWIAGEILEAMVQPITDD